MTVVPLAIAVDLRYRRWRHQFSLFISHDPWFRPMVIQAAGRYPNLAEYYQKNATKFWDNFYKRHKNKFFKDRHYLEKDWGQYFSDDANSANVKVLLEVGCGAGNTIFPLIAAYPELYVQACDISPHAVALVKSHAEFKEDRVNAFLCDVTVDNLLEKINPFSVDVITLVFMLSAVSPHKMPSILQNIKRVLKMVMFSCEITPLEILHNWHAPFFFCCMLSTYKVKLGNKNQMISEGFYVRGDGTCSFYFSEDFLSTLFFQAGFNTVDISTYCKQIKNSHKNITMDRRWVRAVFNNLE
ncbi:tRNA N(3)-methylcytidine methyltransferase trm141-like isoform X1 [Gossypium arboreum]|uniref:tRNA N(3)-methylcytidine methyltransferase trm141-like isoform X1 n=1 Tax=Gossypium arboreum TaxID=29729 RepID=UPI0008191A01|nr:tRNA N(3)-methylcytidine methyltransferase trm141-like isoform X1 [Gossypium arboreum]